MNLGFDEQGVPVCEPFKSIEEVLGWSPPEFCCNGCKAHVQWKSSGFENRPNENMCRPQILICHDMNGGYLDDRFTQGSNNPDAYRFYNWSVIDTFIYFSHTFITVPPFGWICAAHQHGVNVLGTIITEWDAGANMCRQLLQSKDYINNFISKLTDIMLFYGFDGWLINIENKIEPDDVPLLQFFAQQLTVRSHSRLKYSKVLWYDSVIHSGELKWQDELNVENEMFFEVCDGIFLNYGLTEEKLQRSYVKAKASSRQFDVYAGVDVFGRCSPGGGGFNSKQIVKNILQHGLSCALFAQGWVYEHLGQEDFDTNERKFWHLLDDHLPLRCVSLPINTTFCRGYGKGYFLEGKVVSDLGWHNLSLQQLQPSYLCEFESDEAFLGGGCLKLRLGEGNLVPVVKRLFNMHVEGSEPLCVSAIWKICGPKMSYCLSFVFTHESKDCSSALVMMNDCHVDKENIIQSLNSSVFYKKPVLSENVNFQLNMEGTKDKSHGWIESSFCCDAGLFLQCDSCSKESFYVDLAVILLPQETATVEKCTSVSIGFLKVHRQTESKDIVAPINPELHSCLQVEATCPLSQSDFKVIVTHQCFSGQLKPASPKLARKEIDTEVSKVSSTKFECLKLPSISAVSDTGTISSTLYFLHWETFHEKHINFYLIFSVDDSGAQHFLGSSVSYNYVYKHKQETGKYPVEFVILPVLKDACVLPVLGQKIILDLIKK